MSNDQEKIPFRIVCERWKELGFENDDFHVKLTVSDLKSINMARSVLEDVSDIREELERISRLATNLIRHLTFQHRYDPYIERYPDDHDMIAERDAGNQNMLESKRELDEASEKLRRVADVLLKGTS